MHVPVASRLAAVLSFATALTPVAVMAQTQPSWTLTGDYVTNGSQTFLVLGSTGTGAGAATGSGQTSSTLSLPDGLVLGQQAGGNGTGTLTNLFLTVGGGASQYVIVGDQGRGDLTLSGATMNVVGSAQDPDEPNTPFVGVGRRTGSDGVLTVQNGAVLYVRETSGGQTVSGSSSSGVQIGGTRNNEGGTGRVVVDGDGSVISIAGINEAYLNVGRNGASADGTLVLSKGGRIQVGYVDSPQSYIGIGRGGATGTVDVSGAGGSGGSLLNMNGTVSVLEVGGDTAGSAGTLVVHDGGIVGVGSTGGGSGKRSIFNIASDGASGSATVDGSDSFLSVWSSGDAKGSTVMSVGQSAGGTGTLTLSNGGMVFIGSGEQVAEAYAYIGEGENSNGSVTVTGDGSTLYMGVGEADTVNGIAVGYAGTGTLTVADGGLVHVTKGAGAISGISVGATPTGAGTLTASGSGTVVDAGNFFGVGVLPDGEAMSGGVAPLLDGGAGTASFSDGATLYADAVVVGSLNASGSSQRVLSFGGGTRIVAQDVILYPQGLLSGNGSVTGRVILAGGRLSTGSSVGTMAIDGGLRMQSGVMEVKVDGQDAGRYDVYAVTGAAELSGGTVYVVFADSFQPTEGDRYTVVTTTEGATGSETVSTETNRSGVTVQLVPASAEGALDVLVLTGASAAEEVEETEEVATATAQEQTRSLVRTVVTSVSARIREVSAARRGAAVRTAQGLSGLSAGDEAAEAPIGVSAWVDGGVSRLLNDTSGSKFDGYSRNMIVGADHAIGNFVLGGAVALERSTLTLTSTDGDRSSKGVSLIGYVGYLFDEVFSADIQVGAGRLSNRLRETRGGTTDAGDFTSNRLIVASNLSATWGTGDLTLVGTVGASFSRERFDSYATDTGARVSPDTVYLGQVRLGGEAAYTLGPVSPYVSAAYEVDVRSSEGGDRNGAVLGAGLRAPLADNLTAGVFGSAQVLRENDRNYTISANLRYSF